MTGLLAVVSTDPALARRVAALDGLLVEFLTADTDWMPMRDAAAVAARVWAEDVLAASGDHALAPFEVRLLSPRDPAVGEPATTG